MKMIAKIAGWLFVAVLAFDVFLGIYAFMVSPLPGAAQHAIYDVLASRNQVVESIKASEQQFRGDEGKVAEVKSKYASLAAKGNAFVDFVQLGLVSGNLSASEVRLQAERITEEAEKILQAITPEKIQPAPEVILAGFNITDIFEPIRSFLKEGLESRDKKIKEINDRLEKNRWPEWEKISE